MTQAKRHAVIIGKIKIGEIFEYRGSGGFRPVATTFFCSTYPCSTLEEAAATLVVAWARGTNPTHKDMHLAWSA